MYHLLLIVLLSGGTFQSESRDFDSQARCEGFRESVIVQAKAQDNLWLISSCGGTDEPAKFGVFFREKKVEAGDRT